MPDMSDIQGLEFGKKAMEVSAAGGHSVFLEGPPGSGKIMLARRLVTIMPDISNEERNEITRNLSMANLLDKTTEIKRPFRAPHYTISDAGMFGRYPEISTPGEVDLAKYGVLLLDEVKEFRTNSLYFDNRDVIVVASSYLCKCGFEGSNIACKCTDREKDVWNYKHKHFLSTFDIKVTLGLKQVCQYGFGEESKTIRERVSEARKIQKERGCLNSQLCKSDIYKYCGPMNKMVKYTGGVKNLNEVLKIARTIADLKQKNEISTEDVDGAMLLVNQS